jgi:hypothetical protein
MKKHPTADMRPLAVTKMVVLCVISIHTVFRFFFFPFLTDELDELTHIREFPHENASQIAIGCTFRMLFPLMK